MKKHCYLIVFALVGIQCGQFPTRYERIEPDALRSIGFVYKPYAEGAPGDIIRVGAYFAGEKVVSISWQMSYTHIVDPYSGTDTVADIAGLPVFDLVSWLPDSVSMAFVVPDSAFFLTRAITSQTLDLLRSQLPQSMRLMTQQDLAALLKDLGAVDFNDPLSVTAYAQRWGPVMGITTLSSAALDSIEIISGKILTLFSILGVLFANAISDQGHRLKIKGDFTIRYNRRFQNSTLAGFDFNQLPTSGPNPFSGTISVNDITTSSVAFRWMPISSSTLSSVAAINWCICSGSDPSTKYGLYP
jgi:hypothetical protein